jgi:hypothetical protein
LKKKIKKPESKKYKVVSVSLSPEVHAWFKQIKYDRSKVVNFALQKFMREGPSL